MKVIGIDPGLTGALALLTPDGISVVDIPVVDKRINPHALADILAGWGQVEVAAVERSQAYPNMGVSGAFNYGIGYGTILAVLATLERPVVHVAPSAWTKALQVGADKDAHRRRAIETWPAQAHMFARKKDDGRADAALIALWAARQPGAGVRTQLLSVDHVVDIQIAGVS